MSATFAVRTENLSKTYKRGKDRVEAVKGLNLEVPVGQVFGFLGPNGAGKTTTIRMIMDLIRPTRGSAWVLDQPVRKNQSAVSKVGAMIESPGFYSFLTGRENLIVLARTANLKNLKRVDRVLEQVDLLDRAGRRMSDYSTGMKQRLGIASALLSDPELNDGAGCVGRRLVLHLDLDL